MHYFSRELRKITLFVFIEGIYLSLSNFESQVLSNYATKNYWSILRTSLVRHADLPWLYVEFVGRESSVFLWAQVDL